MKAYLIPFLAYLLIRPAVSLFASDQIAYAVHVVVGIGLLTYFWKEYKLSLRFDFSSVIVGALIAVIWIGAEGIFPSLYDITYEPGNMLFLASKLIGFLALAPLIEELFTRSFLMRYIISKDWKSVPIGKYTLSSFIVTVLFFGFAHNRWLIGMITGAILNLWLYKTKRIESCITAHAVANLGLAVYIMMTGSWFLW